MNAWWRRSFLIGSMVSAGLVITAGGLKAQPPNPPGAPVRIVSPLPVPTTGTTTVSGTVDVNVVSGAVDVSVVDGQAPLNFAFTCSTEFIGCGPAQPYEVPAGHRLVIEYVSARALALPAGDAVMLELRTRAGGISTDFWMPPPPVSLQGHSANSQAVKLYADTGSLVFVTARRASNQGGGPTTSYSMSFSGYLVPVD